MKCGIAKGSESFGKLSGNRTSPDGLKSVCKACHNAESRARYYADLEASRASARETAARWRRNHPGASAASQLRYRTKPGYKESEQYQNQLRSNARYISVARRLVREEKFRRGACVDCGLRVTQATVAVFDFDHDDRSTKRSVVGAAGGHAKVLAELAKCSLRCANCHRLRTHLERHWERTGGDSAPEEADDSMQLSLFPEAG